MFLIKFQEYFEKMYSCFGAFRNVFFKNHAENVEERLVPDICLFYKKSYIWSKSKWLAAQFQYGLVVLNLRI